MKNILIINAHEYYPFSEGRLNRALAGAVSHLTGKGSEIQTTTMKDDNDFARFEAHLNFSGD